MKKWKRDRKVKLIDQFNPEWRDLHEEIDSNINRVDEFATRKVFRD